MDLLRELTTWVAAGSGLTIGTTLFAGHLLVETADDCAVILERGGTPSKPLLRGNVGEYGFQVLARGLTYFSARKTAQAIHAVLSDAAGRDLGDHQCCVAEAEAEPQFLGFDSRGRYEFSTNYTVRAYNKAAWAAH